jgi:hypothetical protein
MDFNETDCKYDLQWMVLAQNTTTVFFKHGIEFLGAITGGNL